MSDTGDNESLLEFPCEFPIKMMGRDTQSFRDIAQRIVEAHSGPLAASAIQSSKSRNGTFVSVTVTIVAISQEQLDNIYRAATAHEDVLMAL